MTTTLRCPACQQPAAVSEDFDPAVTVRCPHCDTVVPLANATPCDELPQAEPNQPLAAFLPCEAETTPAALELVIRCPHCQAEAALSELTVAATGEPLDAAILTEALEASHGVFNASDSEEESSHDETFAFKTAVHSDSGTPTAAWTRQPGNKGVLGRALGILLGGLLAIPLAYYILNAVGGEAFDLFPVPLPGVQHTYRHLPPWWPDWARPRSNPSAPTSDP